MNSGSACWLCFDLSKVPEYDKFVGRVIVRYKNESQNMIRWQSYAKNGHGGNVELRGLDFAHFQQHFRYSILDIYKSTANDTTILTRESYDGGFGVGFLNFDRWSKIFQIVDMVTTQTHDIGSFVGITPNMTFIA